VIVWRQPRVRAEATFFHKVEPASQIESDEWGIVRPRVHAEPGSSEEPALLVGPCKDDIHQAAAGVVSGARNAVKIEMRASFVRPPDGGVLVCEREYTADRIVNHSTKQLMRANLAENCGVGELWPDGRSLLALGRPGELVGGANIGEVVRRGWLDSHVR
jgi:hypothetical protein